MSNTIDNSIQSDYNVAKAIEFLTILPKGVLLFRKVSERKSCFLNFNTFNKAGAYRYIGFIQRIRDHATDEFTKKLKEKVQSAKAQKEWRVEYMTYSLLFHDVMRDARSEGREEGREEGLEMGREVELMNLIRCKIRKGKSVLQIADELERTETEIRELYERVCKELEKDNFDK